MEVSGLRAGRGYPQLKRESDVFRRLVVLVVISSSLLLVGAGTAWAPRVHLLPGYSGECAALVNGEEFEGTFQGQASVEAYEAKENTVVATILLNGTCTVAGRTFSLADAVSSTPVTVTDASCRELRLQLGEALAKDVIVDLSGDEILLTPERRDKGIFCRIAKARVRRSPANLAADLNTLLNR